MVTFNLTTNTLNLIFLIGTVATHSCLYLTSLQITKGTQAGMAKDGDDVDALLDRLAEDGKYFGKNDS